MNKKEVAKLLSEKLEITIDDALKINEILENNLIFGRKGKEKILTELQNKLNITPDKANDIYNQASKIISKEIKNKIKHPFKSND